MRERRTDDEVRLLDNRRRANSHKIERQNHEFKTKENERRAEALKVGQSHFSYFVQFIVVGANVKK